MLAGIVVWSLASDLRPPEPPTRSVATASHDLAPGTTLTAADLVVAARPVDAVAVDAVADAALVTGRVVAFPVRSGEQLRERDVVGRELLESDFVDSDFDSDFDSDVPDPESLEDPPAGTVEDEPERLSVR